MPRWLMVLGLAGVAAWIGCAAGGATVAPPAPIHPMEQFPAPPGFQAHAAGPGAWAFHGVGTPAQAALFYRVSCVEFFDWTVRSDDEHPDGSRRLEFTRGTARLSVDVRAGGAADSLRVLVTLERAQTPPSTTPTESNRGDVAPHTARDRD